MEVSDVARTGRWAERMIEKDRCRDDHRASITTGVIVVSVVVLFILWWFRTSRRQRRGSSPLPPSPSSPSSVLGTAEVRKTSWPSKDFRLLIDGCNGPIKFCPDKLTSQGGPSMNPPCTPLDILPALFSMLSYLLGNANGMDDREHTKKRREMRRRGGRRRYSDMLTLISVDVDSTVQNHDQQQGQHSHHQKETYIDLVDSLERLFEYEDHQEGDSDGGIGEQMDGGGEEDRSKILSSPPCSIIFDGVARFSRSNYSTTSLAKPNDEKNHTNSRRGHNRVHYISDRIQIEITGIHEEADNVLVDRCLSSTKNKNSWIRSSTTTTSSLSRPSRASIYYEVIIVERTEIGPGKHRSIFQPLHLLRPSSVLCLFTTGFPPKLQHQSNQILQKLQRTTQKQKNKLTKQQLFEPLSKPSSPFFELKTVRIESGSREGRTSNGDEAWFGTTATIVVTDDIYLRQRVVFDAKCFVMTFDQLRTLLLCSYDD